MNSYCGILDCYVTTPHEHGTSTGMSETTTCPGYDGHLYEHCDGCRTAAGKLGMMEAAFNLAMDRAEKAEAEVSTPAERRGAPLSEEQQRILRMADSLRNCHPSNYAGVDWGGLTNDLLAIVSALATRERALTEELREVTRQLRIDRGGFDQTVKNAEALLAATPGEPTREGR